MPIPAIVDLKITPSGQTIVKPTALGPVANTDAKLLIYGLFQKGRVLAQDAVSRVVSRLKERFEEWQNRDLSEEVYAIVYLDGFHLKVRMAKRVISVPVLAALGIAPDGQKRLLSLRLAVSEASTHWGSMLEGLQAQGLRAPKLVISDGHKGLTKALEKWPGCRVQRCTEHKRANLLQHCPAHARRELRRDYNRIVYAKNGIDARKAYDELVAKWTPLAPAVVRSLEEAGNQLLTFYEFPRAMWKSIRTTNALENLNREFRRRTKTQASFSSEESAVALLFGLIASGQIQLRRIDGYQGLSEVLKHAEVGKVKKSSDTQVLYMIIEKAPPSMGRWRARRTASCCRRATLSRVSLRRALKAEMRARTNDEIMQAWCRQTGD